MTKTIYHDTDSIEDEDAVISVIADKLGAKYPFRKYGDALQRFITIRNWMFYGLNPFLLSGLTTKRGKYQDNKN